jgi:uncharacterized YigZ family protein
METDSFKTILKPSSGFYKDKGSKFHAFAFPVKQETDIRPLMESLKKEHHNARHHCYAYAIGYNREVFRQYDDGEPSGTAGKPIFGQLLSYDVTNVLIVVVRYFGGVKLGVRGLIDAYKNAASDALANADIIKQLIKDYYELRFEYDQMSKVMYLIKEFGLDQVETELTGSCRMVVAVRQQDSDKVKNKFEELYPLKINLVK